MPDEEPKNGNGKAPGFSEASATYGGIRGEPPIKARPVDYRTDFGDNPHKDERPTISHVSAFTKAEALSRSGNFLVPFGLPGSGKTTFLASLFKLLDESSGLETEIIIPERNKIANYAGQALITKWTERWKHGRFLGATPGGDDNIRDIEYKVMPQRGQKTQLTFSVVEVSGEDLKRVIATEHSEPRLPDAIQGIFQNPRIRPIIALIVHPNMADNDVMFDNLFVQLRRIMGPRLKTVKLMVVVANPPLALARMKQQYPEYSGHQTMTPDIAKLYLKLFAKKTYSILQSWPKQRRAVLPFYVGEVELVSEGDQTYERVKRFDEAHIKLIFRWLYFQFTGKMLGATWWQRLLSGMKE